jgi:hypothetical protein
MGLKKKKAISSATPRHLLQGAVSKPCNIEGKVFVKKANMWLDYVRFNTKNEPDIQKFS